MTGENYLKKQNFKKQALNLSRDQKKKAGRYEMLFKQFLIREGVRFVFQKPFWTSQWFYCVDFYIPSLKLVIEIDGSQHYSSRKRRRHDRIRTSRLIKSKKVSEVIRVKNSEMKSSPQKVYENVVLKIKQKYGNR